MGFLRRHLAQGRREGNLIFCQIQLSQIFDEDGKEVDENEEEDGDQELPEDLAGNCELKKKVWVEYQKMQATEGVAFYHKDDPCGGQARRRTKPTPKQQQSTCR